MPSEFNEVNQNEQSSNVAPQIPPEPTNNPQASATPSWFSGGKLIAIIIIALLVIGVGVYFAFFAKTPQTANQANPEQTNKQINNQAIPEDSTKPVLNTTTDLPSTEFKFVSPKGEEKWQSGTAPVISWTGGGKYYATVLTFHYTISTGPYSGQTGQEVINTVKNQPGKNLDSYPWLIEPAIASQIKGPFTISACLVEQLPGNAYSGCKSETITSQPFDIEAKSVESLPDQSLLYINQQLGFQIQFTDTWAGYKALTDGENGVHFDLPKYKIPTEYGGVFSPLSITIMPQKEYEDYKAKNDPALTSGQLVFLGTKGEKAFLYTDIAGQMLKIPEYATIYPKDSSGKPIDFEVKKIITSFKFIK